MAKKQIAQSGNDQSKTLTWERFMELKDRYVGQVCEAMCANNLVKGEITRFEVTDGVFSGFCQNLQMFSGKWEHYLKQESKLFDVIMSKNEPIDLGFGTIKLISADKTPIYLKLSNQKQRA